MTGAPPAQDPAYPAGGLNPGLPPQDALTPDARHRLDEAAAAVPDGKRGRLELAAALGGASASIGWRATERWDVSAYAARTWAGAGSAGVRARYTW